MTKKIIIFITSLIFLSGFTQSVFALPKFQKPVKPQEIVKESIGNSIIQAEYPEGSEVAPIIKNEQREADLLIEGSVEKLLDVTLNDCLKLAMGNNPRIKAAINNSLASHARITQKWSNYFPTVSWTTSGSRNRNLLFADAIGPSSATYNYYLLGNVSLSQLIYDFGVTQNEVTIKKMEYESYKQTLASTINEVVYSTKDAYYNLLFAQDNKRVAEDTVLKFELFYNQAKALYEIGLNPKVDVTIAEVNLSDAKLKLIQADNMIDIAMARLNNTMGLPYDTRFTVSERLNFCPIEIKLVEAYEIAKISRPDFKIAELKVDVANQAVKLARKSFAPTIKAEGAFMVGGRTPTANYGYNYGLFLDFPQINGLLLKSQIDEAKSLYDAEIANAQASKNDIYYEVQDAYLKLLEKRNQIPVSMLQVKQAKENYELSFGRYRVGVGNPIELKDAQVAYQLAQLNYYQSLYYYNSARAALEKAIGKNIITDEEPTIDFE